MNIFATNQDPIIAARELCDQHVRSKMMIESAIMLQHCFDDNTLRGAPYTKSGKARKSGKGYANHPCSVWVRKTKANYMWLVDHALEMFNERDYRWPGSPFHFTHTFIDWCKKSAHLSNVSKGPLTPFAIAINEQSACRQIKNFHKLTAIRQYQLYIQHDKEFATWTKRKKPSWMNN